MQAGTASDSGIARTTADKTTGTRQQTPPSLKRRVPEVQENKRTRSAVDRPIAANATGRGGGSRHSPQADEPELIIRQAASPPRATRRQSGRRPATRATRPPADGPRCVTKHKEIDKPKSAQSASGRSSSAGPKGLFAAPSPPRAAEELFAFWSPFGHGEDCF